MDVLVAMAKIGSKIKVQEVKKSTGISSNSLNQIIIKLIDKGLIYRLKRGPYSFTLPLMEKYILRRLKSRLEEGLHLSNFLVDISKKILTEFSDVFIILEEKNNLYRGSGEEKA